ncbi:unnamed protein product [Diplocarpon coronariae]
MQLSNLITIAAILATASLCNATCDGKIEEADGWCEDGVNLFCYTRYPKCTNNKKVSFGPKITQKNEETCKGKGPDSQCKQKFCCS